MIRFVHLTQWSLAGFMLAAGANGRGWLYSILGLALLIGGLRGHQRRSRLIAVGTAASIWFGIHVAWMQVLGIDAWLLLVTLCVLPWLLLAVIPLPQRGLSLYLVPTSLIVLIEWLHDNVPWGGFPWGNLAYSQLDGPFVGFATLGGQSLVTVVVCVLAIAVVRLVQHRKLPSVAAIFLFLSFASNWAQGAPGTATAEQVIIAVIQGGSSDQELRQEQEQWQVFNRHIQQTEQLASAIESGTVASPELIVWPENSTDVDPLNNAAAYKRIQALVERVQVPVLIGGVTWQSNPYGPRNAGVLWEPESGPSQLYAKTHLVPFGEYIPFRDLLVARIGRLSQIASDFVPGRDPGIFELRGRTFGDVICFEIAYEDHLTELVHGGADFFTLQTNNATYLGTNQSEQQMAIARFRAIEHRRSIAMASTTGVSGLIDDSGEVVAQSKQGESTYLSAAIPSVSSTTFTDRHPHWVVVLALWSFAIWSTGQMRNKRRVNAISHTGNR